MPVKRAAATGIPSTIDCQSQVASFGTEQDVFIRNILSVPIVFRSVDVPCLSLQVGLENPGKSQKNAALEWPQSQASIRKMQRGAAASIYLLPLWVLELIRAKAWWEHKLSPLLATIYATAAFSRIPFSSLWPVIILALLALIVCASYVSLLNDLTDAEDDRASGKDTRARRGSRYPALLLATCLVAGAALLFVWRKDTLLFSAYLLPWLAFALYSLPPCRLKARGILGVLADASGAHLFPALFVVFLLYQWTQTQTSLEWLVAVSLWSFPAGIRGILWHQLADAENDRKIGLRTFACLRGPAAAERLGRLAFFLEMASFFVMLWLTRNALAALLLVLYGFCAWIRWRRLGIGLIVVKPDRTSRIAMTEYYNALYPLAYLLTAGWQQASALWLLLFHLLLFFRPLLCLLGELVAMVRTAKPAAGTEPAVFTG